MTLIIAKKNGIFETEEYNEFFIYLFFLCGATQCVRDVTHQWECL